mmetsp:Transcript_6527/g.9224  ORF Transcript_6527/g.9224 Transcript_6527/m.9224 type:complete len:423 (+) Transcript_6527:96-1364(+)
MDTSNLPITSSPPYMDDDTLMSISYHRQESSSSSRSSSCLSLKKVEETAVQAEEIMPSSSNNNYNNNNNAMSKQPPSLTPLTFAFPSIQECKERLYEYWYEPIYVLEVVGCIVLFIVASLLPHYLVQDFDDRPIPIGYTSDGEAYLDLQYSYDANVTSTVSGQMNVYICFCITLPLMIVMGLPLYGDAHASVCMYFVARSISGCLVACLKLYCGYFRPHFYSKCQLDVSTGKCQNANENQVLDAHHSFPSGHSALAFCTMTMVTLLCMGKVGPQRFMSNVVVTPTRMLLKKMGCLVSLCVPMGLAIFIAASRIHDYKHHPADVIAGSLIGFASAKFAHSMYYPSVYSNWCAGYPLHQTMLFLSSNNNNNHNNAQDAMLLQQEQQQQQQQQPSLTKSRRRTSTVEMTSDDEDEIMDGLPIELV